ncbi:uncharacterized protein YbbK (DUF523 family) [Melghirimyces profundicolus]|uniref:Uncharacterized protein YbbK (DUF523 family) n=1 Tax=Melghirimyces profundicolus TaxID=1242148 RepID=A0A2T6C7U3_9BACL|nr:DUF523 and DUF1722 domain-containing protein [Melghirimyces profundicolus]PTX64353.1 uncharacterized protein YbbK (DUF523 family) [Melghirimyces profundicolus]
MNWESDVPVLRVGISSCLLGERVRYNGAHKYHRFINRELGRFFRWVPVCPEVELGLGVPRETIRLESDGREAAPRLVATKTRRDLTEAMEAYSERRLAELSKEPLHGYILKKGSPSCGLREIPIHHHGEEEKEEGRGLFAEALLRRFPGLPVAEETELEDPGRLAVFIGRVAARWRWLSFLSRNPGSGDLVEFHTRQKLSLLSHSRDLYTRLGRIAADGDRPVEERLKTYGEHFMEAVAKPATRKRHTDVLTHLEGRLKDFLPAEEKGEIREAIEAFRKGRLPLTVPLTLLRYHFMRRKDDWAKEQTYLNPLPIEWLWKREVDAEEEGWEDE